jgi:hypothetical protein
MTFGGVCVSQTAEYFPKYKLAGRRAQRFSMDEDADGRIHKYTRQQRSVCYKWEHGGGSDLKPGVYFLVLFPQCLTRHVLSVV